jgi:hypothetical protein
MLLLSIRRVAVLLFLVVLSGLFVYSFMLSRPFDGMDDQASIVYNPLIHSLENLPQVFEHPFFNQGSYYRPLVSLSFLLEHHFFQTQAFFYNLDNLLLHVGIGMLVFYLVILLTGERLWGLGIALLWMVHPIYWEAVAFVSGRSILLCAFFFILSFVLYVLSGRENNLLRYVLSLLCFGLALLSKELAVVLPGVLVSYEVLLNSRKEKLNAVIGKLIPYVLCVILFLWARQIVLKQGLPFWDSWQSLILGFLTFLRGLGTYLRLFILPWDIHYDRSIPYYSSLTDPDILGIMGISAGVVFMIWINRDKIPPVLWFALCWSIFTFLPVSQLIPLRADPHRALMAEHFLYLPSIGIWLWLGYFLKSLARECMQSGLMRRGYLWVSLGSAVGAFMLVTIQQNIYTADGISVFKQTLSYVPSNTRVRNSLALTYVLNHQFQEAEKEYRTILRYDPWDVAVRANLGKVLMDQGRFEEAIAELKVLDHVDVGPLRSLLEDHHRHAQDTDRK